LSLEFEALASFVDKVEVNRGRVVDAAVRFCNDDIYFTYEALTFCRQGRLV
jgi:hypothetical protein